MPISASMKVVRGVERAISASSTMVFSSSVPESHHLAAHRTGERPAVDERQAGPLGNLARYFHVREHRIAVGFADVAKPNRRAVL